MSRETNANGGGPCTCGVASVGRRAGVAAREVATWLGLAASRAAVVWLGLWPHVGMLMNSD